MKVGFKYLEYLKENKVLAHRLHFYTPLEVSGQYIVKETKDAKKSSTGTVGLGVEWHVVKANIITCTCSYFKSSLMLYPCACVVASRAEDLNIDNPIHVHPYYWIVFRPMYLVALHTLRTADYRNAPWSKQLEALPATHNSSLLYQSKGSRNLYIDAYGLPSVKKKSQSRIRSGYHVKSQCRHLQQTWVF